MSNSVTDHDGMIFDHGAAQSRDLVARRLARRLVLGVVPGLHGEQVGGDIRPQRMHVAFQLGAQVRHIGAYIAEKLEYEVF